MNYTSLTSLKLKILALVNVYNIKVANYDITSQELNNLYSEITSAVQEYNTYGYFNSVIEKSMYKAKAELIDRDSKHGKLYIKFEWGVF